MESDLPVPTDDGGLPTLSEAISNWLGFQLPTIPLPQTVKNFDKAIGQILLAASENGVARIKANTGKLKAKGKIAIEGMYRTEEERRKLENRAAAVKVAVDELNEQPATQDATHDIDDDWLNLFAKLSEDKSSDELRGLFGKILAGEIRKPGSFSLRTMQFIATVTRNEAHKISEFFAFVINGEFVLLLGDLNTETQPGLAARRFVNDLAIASAPTTVGGLHMKFTISPLGEVPLRLSGFGIKIENASDAEIHVSLECQVLTDLGKELYSISNPPLTPIEYLKREAELIATRAPGSRSPDSKVKVSVLQLLQQRPDGSFSAKQVYEPQRDPPP